MYKWYAVYGDLLWYSVGVKNPERNPQGFHGMVRDSVSALGNNRLVFHNLN